MTAAAGVRHVLGLAAAAAAAYAGYWVWTHSNWLVRQVPQRDPLFDLPLRTVVGEQRMILMLIAAVLGLSLLDWLWRKTLGRLG